ncbi:MAG TPA: Holliday junction resolvase Hjc [archaeon]|nr:Holliday junction resolvase Hjc [archaeon]
MPFHAPIPRMTRYAKGANAERELVHLLFDKGFSVIRTAGSGKTSLPAPDIIAMKPSKHLAFECKAWASNNLSIPVASMEEFLSWCTRAGVEAIIAWKYPRKGWFFLKPEMLHNTGKYYAISKKDAERHNQYLEVVTGIQAQLK